MNTLTIGTYGPGSALVGGLAMLPEEARTIMRELTGKIVPIGQGHGTRYYRIKNAYLWGDEYGQVIAQCIKSYAPDHVQQRAPFAPDWAPLQGW